MTPSGKYIVLGVHFGHDAGAALLVDGQIVADVTEERFIRAKHSSDLPLASIGYCLKVAGVSMSQVDEIAVAGLRQGIQFKQTFGLELPGDETHSSLSSRIRSGMGTVSRVLARLPAPRDGGIPVPTYSRQFFLTTLPKVTLVEHHLAHASCAYYTSNDKRKMIIATVDGTGDSQSSCIWLGKNGRITPLVKYGGESSIGWFYSNVTEAIGWWHGDGEGKTMGLAPYGDFSKCRGVLDPYYPRFKNGELVAPYDFSPFSRYMRLGAAHWHNEDALAIAKLVKQYGKEDISAEAQRVLEQEVMEFVLPWLAKEGTDVLATSGGVFLNVKLNQRIWMSGKVATHYPYPNPGDAGLAVGAALYTCAMQNRLASKVETHLYWGPEYGDDEIEQMLKRRGVKYRRSSDVATEAAVFLANDKILGWFQGRMECGPRALGNRSILMSPKKKENKDIINARVKFREAFRPFCPSMTVEAMNDYLVKPRLEKYMVTSFDCVPSRAHELPAVVHVDGTLRPQTVTKEDNPKYWKLITEFGRLTGTPVLLNTSLNIMGEPMICAPSEAIRCFYDSGIDALVLGDFIIEKDTAPLH